MFSAATILHGNFRDNYATLSQVIEGKFEWENHFKNRLTYENFVEAIQKYNYESKLDENRLMTAKVLMAHQDFQTYNPTDPVLILANNFVKTVLENNKGSK